MVFILLLPVHVRYGLVLQSSLGRAEDGKSWIRASSRSDNRGAFHRDLQLNPPNDKKDRHCEKTKAGARPKIFPPPPKITRDELRPFLTIFGTSARKNDPLTSNHTFLLWTASVSRKQGRGVPFSSLIPSIYTKMGALLQCAK